MNSQYNNPNMDEMINYLEDVLEVAKNSKEIKSKLL